MVKINTKLSSKFDEFITILKKGPSYKCFNKTMLRKFAYSFLMTSIPCIDLDISYLNVMIEF